MCLSKFKEDIRVLALINHDPSFIKIAYLLIRSLNARILFRIRLSNYFFRLGGAFKFISWYLYHSNLKCGIDVHPEAQIGKGLRIAHPVGLVIGKDVVIGDYVRLQQFVTLGGNSGKKNRYLDKDISMPIIGNFCLIGPGAVVIGPVLIGNGAVIGANSVITKSVDPWFICAGNPAQQIKKISRESLYSIHYKEMVPQDAFK